MAYFEGMSGTVFESDYPQYHTVAKRIPAKEGAARVKQQACDALREVLKPGDTVHTILRHVSKSGVSRSISLIIAENGEVCDITDITSRAMSESLDTKNRGIKIGGCGMNMGFQLVYLLGCALWPDGTPASHGTRNGEPDTSGGYALKQRWL